MNKNSYCLSIKLKITFAEEFFANFLGYRQHMQKNIDVDIVQFQVKIVDKHQKPNMFVWNNRYFDHCVTKDAQ